MMKLTKTVLSVFLAMAFAAGSLNVSATESDVELDKQAKTPTAAERNEISYHREPGAQPPRLVKSVFSIVTHNKTARRPR